ncbi:hypothetical protein CANARDRAFT_7917 [[Candida] arabinofermentans NRRL YB-2248]|uniref:Swiss Army Knife RNA repair protein HAD domain-containing protein n=1 Tax=[Candida] arabinofermentans NRRL YB-2248 TaxID=983967 RepID=A0A1E4T0L0_9ASCO|nr:hypothetical protein CANARDRAFT_7917 [[Candida] arabinofermentans NRRL YB-2248]
MFKASPLCEYNVQSQLNPHLNLIKDDLKAIYFYKFDHTLFKTPVPNPSLFASTTIDTLTNSVDPLSSLNWYASTGVIRKMYNPDVESMYDKYWNKTLIQLIQLTENKPGVLSILISDRIPELFSDLIVQLLELKQLPFDAILITEKKHILDELITSCHLYYPQLNEITYYSNTPDIELTSDKLFPTIDFFKIKVPYQSSNLLPVVEVSIVQGMMDIYSTTEQKIPPLQFRKAVYSSQYRLTYHSHIKFLKKFITENFIPESYRSNLIFEGLDVFICKNQISSSKLAKLGGVGKKVKFGTLSQGKIEGKIYAIKLLCNDENIETLIPNGPFLVLARAEGVPLLEVENITDWQMTDELVDLEGYITHTEKLKIANGPDISSS